MPYGYDARTNTTGWKPDYTGGRPNPTSGTCATCGGDWSSGNRDEPRYDCCTCEPTADREPTSEADRQGDA